LQGLYPKDFKFTGWHPLCRCFAVPVLKTVEEMGADNVRMLRGEEPSSHSVNEVRDVPEKFKEWVETNKDRIAVSVYKDKTPYFLKDNDKYVHLDRFKATKLQKFTVDSRKEYLQHDKEQWQRAYFNKENGGYLLVDKERIAQGAINKQEKGKYEKELSMCQTLAKNGYKVEYLKMTEGSFDIYLNGMAADLKKTVGSNMEKYAKKAITKQGAKVVVFEFEKNTNEIKTKLLKLSKENIHGHYYFSDERDKIYRF
jgi:hypothetical protein